MLLRFLFFFLIFFLFIFYGYQLFVVKSLHKQYMYNEHVTSFNKKTYTTRDIHTTSSVGVAVTTNVGMRLKESNEVPIKLYKDVVDIGYIFLNNQEAKNKVITTHILLLQEYVALLKTDIQKLLLQSRDRQNTLENFISQLKYRYDIGNESIQTLTTQKQELIYSLSQQENKINTIKQKIAYDFEKFNTFETVSNIDAYLQEKNQYTAALVYLTFVNKFISEYELLQAYNKKLIEILEKNREALIKNVQITVPEKGEDILYNIQLLRKDNSFFHDTR